MRVKKEGVMFMQEWKSVLDRVCNNKKNWEKYQELNMKLDEEKTKEEKLLCKYVSFIRLNSMELETDVEESRRQLLISDCNIKTRKLEELLDKMGWEK